MSAPARSRYLDGASVEESEAENASPRSANTQDEIDAILDNYHLKCEPELRLKFRRRCVRC
jgi:hypothetical protein